MIQSNKVLYQEINSIIDVLKGSGNEKFARKLADALSISTIPSEILGESRIALEELSKTELPGELKIQAKIEESLKYLNEIL